METGVEYCHLRYSVSQQLCCRSDAPEVGRIVKRSQIDAVLDLLYYILSNLDRSSEMFAAMYDTVAYCMDITE